MPHNRFFTAQPLKQGSNVILQGDEHHHMVHVMRASQNEMIELINGQGYLAQARIQHLDKTKATCSIELVHFTQKSSTSIIIAQAFLRGHSLELIIEKNTELGADELWLFPGYLSEKDSLSSHQQQRLEKHILSAVKQCARLYIPQLKFFDTLQDLLTYAVENSYKLYYGDTALSAPSLFSLLQERHGLIQFVFCVGPEKGFHEKEISQLQTARAQGVSLNHNILRAETASIAATALLAHMLS